MYLRSKSWAKQGPRRDLIKLRCGGGKFDKRVSGACHTDRTANAARTGAEEPIAGGAGRGTF
jgi:hypothetical protein